MGVSQYMPPQEDIECVVGNIQGAPLPSNYQYSCTDPNIVKYIRVNMHFMRTGALIKSLMNVCDSALEYYGYGNFTLYSNGFASPTDDPVSNLDYSYNGFDRAEDIVNKMNAYFLDNKDAFRKSNNPLINIPPLTNVSYPSPPPNINIQFVLSGVFFHETHTANSISYFYSWQNDYAKNPDTEINIYFHASPNEALNGQANWVGGTLKFNSQSEYYIYASKRCRSWSLGAAARSVLHEIGHNLNLYHTSRESSDYCDDTPKASKFDLWKNGVCYYSEFMNCWAFNVNNSLSDICPGSSNYPCDEWHEVSNNYMDYNQYKQSMTVCQISRMQSDLATKGNKYIYSCGGCAPASAYFYLLDEYRCPGLPSIGSGIHFIGQASFNEDQWQLEICEVSGSTSDVCITGTYYNSGYHSGQVSNFDLTNIYSFPISTTTKYYKVKLTCGNSNCLPSHTYQKTIKVTGCLVEDEPDKFVSMKVINPVSNELNALYTVHQKGEISLRLVNGITGSTINIESATIKEVGDYYVRLPTLNLPIGNYCLQLFYNGQLISKNLIVL